MQIQEVCKKTGYTKRNIYFYIHEGLLSPSRELSTGYYEFTEADCECLILIQILRTSGFSIPVIRSLLKNPGTASHYINQRMKAIQKEQKKQEQILSGLNYVMDNLSINPNLNQIYRLCKHVNIPYFIPEQITMPYDTYDNLQINRFLWAVFLPQTPLTEYQEFLWEKLNKLTNSSENGDCRKINRFLQSLDIGSIERIFAKNESHIRYIAELEDHEEYILQMKKRIRMFFEVPSNIDEWKKCYNLFLYPKVRIYDGECGQIAGELSPLFVAYCNNIHVVCNTVYQWLHSEAGRELYDKIHLTLDGYVDIEHNSHGELEILANFRQLILGDKW